MINGSIGVIFVGGDSWWEAGFFSARTGPYKDFANTIRTSRDQIVEKLTEIQDVEFYFSDIIHTNSQIDEWIDRGPQGSIDGLIICPLLWTNDPLILHLLSYFEKVPLMVWSYAPTDEFPKYFNVPRFVESTGSVSAQQITAILKNRGLFFSVVHGSFDNPSVSRKITAFARASRTKVRLRRTRIAVVPAPCRIVVSTWYDESFLSEYFGIELVYISVKELSEIIEAVPESAAQDYLDYLKSIARSYAIDSEQQAMQSAKQALGLVELAKKYGLSGIALDDFNEDIYSTLRFRPHLYHHGLSDNRCTIGFEADVHNVLSTIILSSLGSKMAMFNELLCVDTVNNQFLMGHPGHGEADLADPETYEVTPDLEFDKEVPRGLWLSYRALRGKMTFLNFTYLGGKLESAVFKGTSLPGKRVLEGYTHMVIRPDTESSLLFEKILEMGLIQHWATALDDLEEEIREFSGMIGMVPNFLE